MKKNKYKFSIDERRPDIPAPADFSSVLSKVKIKLPWYAKSGFWGGAAVSCITIVASVLWYQSHNTQQSQTAVLKLSQNPTKPIVPAIVETTENQAGEVDFFPEIQNSERETAHFQVLDYLENAMLAEAPSRPQESKVKMPFNEAHSIVLPFDTIYVNTVQLPYVFRLKRGGWLHVPAGSVINNSGQVVNGSFIILYREILSQSDMLVTSLFMHESQLENPRPLINNGAFEIKILKNNEPLSVRQSAPLVLSFEVLSSDPGYSGYQSQHFSFPWTPMHLGLANNESLAAKNSVIKDRMMVKRNFWQWLADLFHGRKIRWDTFERADYNNYNPGKSNLYRTFEIAGSGLYASAMPCQTEFKTKKVKFICEGNEILDPVVYQVYLNQNMVRQYTTINREFDIHYSPADRCILLARVSNTNFFAVIDPNGFDKLIAKNIKAETEVYFQLINQKINSAAELKTLIGNYNKQRTGRK